MLARILQNLRTDRAIVGPIPFDAIALEFEAEPRAAAECGPLLDTTGTGLRGPVASLRAGPPADLLTGSEAS